MNMLAYHGRLRAELEELKKSALNKRVIAAAGEDKFEECEDSDNPREAAIVLLLELELGGTSATREENRRRSSIQPARPSEEEHQRRASRSSLLFRKGAGSDYGISGGDDMDDDEAAQPQLDVDEMMCAFGSFCYSLDRVALSPYLPSIPI